MSRVFVPRTWRRFSADTAEREGGEGGARQIFHREKMLGWSPQ